MQDTKTVKLQELIKWFISDTKIDVTNEEMNMLLSYYKNIDEDKMISDFAYMHENPDNFKNKLSDIRKYNINSLIDWFVKDTRGKINVSDNDINTLRNYYENNKYITENKMVQDFAYMHDNKEYFNKKISKISKEIIKVEDLKDKNELRYIKLIYGNGTEKVYESTLEEPGEVMFDIFMKSGDNSRINTTQFFEEAVQTKNPLTEEEIKELQSIDYENKGGLSNQKRLGAHPGVGKTSSLVWLEEGFMNLLFFIFLTGISTGIILMVVLNNLAK